MNLNGHAWKLAGSGVHFRPSFISGAGAIEVAMGPSGLLLLPNGSSFTGQVVINSGRVEAGTALALGTGDGTPENGTIVAAGATLRFTNTATIAEFISASGDGVAPGMAALDIVNNAPVTINAPVFLSAATRVSVTTTLGAAQTATFQQAIAIGHAPRRQGRARSCSRGVLERARRHRVHAHVDGHGANRRGQRATADGNGGAVAGGASSI